MVGRRRNDGLCFESQIVNVEGILEMFVRKKQSERRNVTITGAPNAWFLESALDLR
jgi:hypothetical protein